jgi:Mce-associated membrane protein
LEHDRWNTDRQVVTTRASGPSGASGSSRTLLYVAIAMIVVAGGCAGWFGWSWYRVAHSSSVSGARVRDEALQQGEQAVQNFNTLDYRTVGQGLKLWQQSSTGPLLREISTGRAQFEQAIRKAKTITTATVLDGSITALNQQAGTADIIVAMQITVTPASGQATTKRSRLEGALSWTTSGWKLSALGQVPVPGDN